MLKGGRESDITRRGTHNRYSVISGDTPVSIFVNHQTTHVGGLTMCQNNGSMIIEGLEGPIDGLTNLCETVLREKRRKNENGSISILRRAFFTLWL